MSAPEVVTIGLSESALDRRERILAEKEERDRKRKESEKVHPITSMFSKFYDNQGS